MVGFSAQERLDVRKVLTDRDLVALPFVVLVPLIVVVKNQSDDVEEILNESVRRGRVDEPMEPAVEIGEIVIALLDVIQQRKMLTAQRLQLLPKQRVLRQCREGHRRP